MDLIFFFLAGSLDVAENLNSRIVIPNKQRKRVKPGVISRELALPKNTKRPMYARETVRGTPEQPLEPQVHDEHDRKSMRTSCRLAAQVLEYAGTLVKPGVTTDYIDRQAHKLIMNSGAYPSPLRYARFPKSICTSVNDVICHGIPDSHQASLTPAAALGWRYHKHRCHGVQKRKGFHGDTSKTFLCGNVDDELKQLVDVTRECLTMAISICGPGVDYRLIGETINEIADRYNYGIVRDFLGHGIGRYFHSAPAIIPYRNRIPGKMQVGETFTIEPILTTGGTEYQIWNDGWTAVTKDGSYAAQFEHTVLILETGVEILTLPL
ncbi:hypothetical protein SELMODRAFT_439350 [Selaginella moellendorffii]|uniref:Methionine aminopeptidase n=1 Tax=Selaginella moellendorffii TaxID=88036 RepID=D8R3S9_SELML|nr:hypothetical protein SELMODRAFT_439350 [Selaginella moellendorffii]